MMNLKSYRGALWKKLNEKEKQIQDLPGFHLDEERDFVELPPMKNLSEIDVKYPLIPPFAYAHIKWDAENQQIAYILEEPSISDEEKELLKKIKTALVDLIQVGFNSVKNSKEATDYLEDLRKKLKI